MDHPQVSQRVRATFWRLTVTEFVDPDFVARLSHIRYRLRTAIAQIIGFAQLLSEDHAQHLDEEMLREAHAIASSGEHLVAMVEQHLGSAVRNMDELNLADAQFQLRLQLNHIAGYTEMLTETAEEEGLPDLLADLAIIITAEQRVVDVLEHDLQPEFLSSEPGAAHKDGAEASQHVQSDLALSALAEGGNLLLVNSDASDRALITRRLARHRYSVTQVESGEAAIALVDSSEFDLILMDIDDDAVGLDTLRRLTSTSSIRDVPVLVLSAADDIDRMVDCVLAGADDYLLTPIRPVLLLARIGAALEQVRLRRRFTRQLRIFISSPGDVIPERRVLKQVIQQLDDTYGHDVNLVPVLWEEEPLVASDTFQAQIVEPRDTDIYVAVLWSRLGSPLPKTILRADGTQYESGTAYEFEDAMRGFEASGRPAILLYRKTTTPVAELENREQVLERFDQIDRLGSYIDRWFRGADGSYVGAFHQFEGAEQLEAMAATHLRKLVDRWLEDHPT